MSELSRNARIALGCFAVIWILGVIILAITTRRGVAMVPLIGFAGVILYTARRR